MSRSRIRHCAGSPWYRSPRIFRQHRFRDWTAALGGGDAAIRRFDASSST